MQLRLTVVDAATGAAHDVEMTAEPDSSVRSLLDALPFPVEGRPAYVADVALDPDGTIGAGPVVAGCVLRVGEAGPDPRGLPPGTAGLLRVLAGPDRGLSVWLPTGSHALGRSPRATVSLSDPQVSRRHASVEVDRRGGIVITDTGSGNGTLVDQVAITAPTALTPRSRIELGDDVLQWLPLPAAGLHSTRSTDGRIDFDRAFAPAPAITRTTVELPTEETGGGGVKAMLASAAAPVGFGVVMAVATQQVLMLLMAAFAPVGVMITGLVERRQRRARKAAYGQARGRAEATITDAVATEERVRRQLGPDGLAVTLAATGAARGLWPRNLDSPDGLTLRVGAGERPASIEVRGEPWKGFEKPVLRDVPTTIDLRATGVLGVVGSPAAADAVTHWLVAQLATLRSPDDLRIVVVTADDGDELAWTRWLPHCDGGEGSPAPALIGNTPPSRTARIAELKELVAARQEELRGHSAVRFTDEVVVVLHGALALRHHPGLREILRDGPAVGVHTICVDRHDMNECRGLIRLSAAAVTEPADTGWHDTVLAPPVLDGALGTGPLEGVSMELFRDRSVQPVTLTPEGMTARHAEGLARALAPMRDRLTLAAGQGAVPYPVRFLDLLGLQVPGENDVLHLWQAQPGPTTQVPLGADGTGTVTVDLAKQGPHTMLAGATGAGKSILLQTLVTSLLLANRPDELNLVLVDFKGGSAFLPFERCPQVVGLIRSTGETPADVFDDAAAARVLASVRAEVRRRESLLARYGGEIDVYWSDRRRDPTLAALPRLVLIFDEFARVLDVSPDFLKELVNVAAKGRSLGMHLLLATQSLQGKLSAELKNNIDLRITLRQNERADSVEVLGVPDATGIPGRLRGRGMILCTKDEVRQPQLFQSGYLGNPPPTGGAAPARLYPVEWSRIGEPRPVERTVEGEDPTDQDLAIAAVEAAALRLGLPRPRLPLQPPLPAEVALENLDRHVTLPLPPAAVPFGLADDPDAQEQPGAFLDLDGSERLMIAGGPQSGRTTAVRALLHSLAERFDPGRAHVYVIEQNPSGLARYAELPHCGGIFSPAEPDRVRRLVTWLGEEVQRRKISRMAPSSGGRTDRSPDPWIVVVVDGWEYLENRADPTWEETSVLATLRTVVTAGAPVGVHVVAVGGQTMMASRLSELFSRRVLLPFPKEETRRAGLPSGRTSPPILPGRAIEAAGGLHLQVAIPRREPADLVAQARTVPASGRGPRLFPSVPARVQVGDLTIGDAGRSATWIPVGVGGPGVTPIGLDLFDTDPHLVLVSGPSGSGRTTAAATFAIGLRRVGIEVLVIAPPRSPLAGMLPDEPGLRLITGTTVKDADLRAAVEFFGEGRYAVVVDDVEQITVTPSQDGFMDAPLLLQDISSPAAAGRQALVLCGDAAPILGGQRRSLARVLQDVLTDSSRIVLSPTHSFAARELGLTLEADQFFAGPPGRGYLGTGRSSHLMQVAVP
jgi:DNA segregation ATPase FtsK/SpoIIIE, S-DNA-T family